MSVVAGGKRGVLPTPAGLFASKAGGDLFGTEKGTIPTTQEPWAAQQPYLKDLFARGQNLVQQGPQSGGLLGQAKDQASATIRGDYLDPYSNPHFKPALDTLMGDVRGQINSQFKGDNYGNSAHQEWLGKGLMNAAAPMLANQYNTERGRQVGLLGLAPSLQEANSPWNQLMKYQQIIGGNYGGTTEQPYYKNNTANTLGSLAALGGILGMA